MRRWAVAVRWGWWGLWLLCLPAAGQDRVDRRRQALDVMTATGGGTYERYCAHCHGDDGKGRGRLWPSDLAPRPADLTATRLDRGQLALALRDGSAAVGKSNLCPPWGRTLSEVQRQKLVAHIERLAGRPVQASDPPAPGAVLESPFLWRMVGLLALELLLLWWVLRFRGAQRTKVASSEP